MGYTWGFTIRPCTIRHKIHSSKYTKSMISQKMYHNLVVLIILGISVEIQCQRHIIGSRLLNFDNDMRFVSPIERQARNSKDIEFEKPGTTAKPNIRTVKDATFDSPLKFNSNAVDNVIDDFEECVPLDKCESLDWLVQNIDTVPNFSSTQVIEKIKSKICGFYGRVPKVLCPIDEDNDIDDDNESEDYDDGYENDDEEELSTTSEVPEAHVENDKLRNEFGPFLFGGSLEIKKNETQDNDTDTLDRVGNALNGLNGGSASDAGGITEEDVLGRAIFKNIGQPKKRTCKGSLLIHHSASNAGPLDDFKQLRLRGKSYRRMRKLRDRDIVQVQTNGNCCWKLHSLSNFRGFEETVYNGFNIVPSVHPKSIKGEICS